MVNGQISKQAEWDALCITNPDTTGSTYTICQKNQQIPKEWFSKVKLFGTISWYNKHSHESVRGILFSNCTRKKL